MNDTVTTRARKFMTGRPLQGKQGLRRPSRREGNSTSDRNSGKASQNVYDHASCHLRVWIRTHSGGGRKSGPGVICGFLEYAKDEPKHRRARDGLSEEARERRREQKERTQGAAKAHAGVGKSSWKLDSRRDRFFGDFLWGLCRFFLRGLIN